MPDRALSELQLRRKRQGATAHPSLPGDRTIGSCATGASHEISLLHAVRGKHVRGTHRSPKEFCVSIVKSSPPFRKRRDYDRFQQLFSLPASRAVLRSITLTLQKRLYSWAITLLQK